MRSLWVSSLLAGLLMVLPAAAQNNSSGTASDAGNSSTVAVADAQDASGGTAAAQTPAAPAQTPAPAPAAAAPPVWSLGPIDFSGSVDGYYSFNFNHPRPDAINGGGNSNEQNFLYNFNIPANQFSLNLIALKMSHSPDPVGFEFDIGYGDALNAIAAASGPNGGSEFDKIVEQAYVSFKPTKAKGFEVDFGKFVTSASAEVIESYNDWNYSRSLLFTWATPYLHFGLRTSWPMGKHWTGGFQVVNGWNNDTAFNTGATLGANATATYSKFTWTAVWYGGPTNYGTNTGWKDLWDSTLTLTPNSKVSAYINYDYDLYRIDSPVDSENVPFGFKENELVDWQGIAGAVHFTPINKWAFTVRYEYFDDPSGFALLGQSLGSVAQEDVSIPVAQHVQEVTGTVEYKFLEGLMWRGEYRIDWSNEPFFLVGEEPADPGYPADLTCSPAVCPSEFGLGNSNHQQTLTFAIIAFFGPKR